MVRKLRPLGPDKAGESSTGDQASARERILRTAARLYAIYGYEGTSMQAIAEAAEVTKPLIYYHFQSKESLFAALLGDSIGTCQEANRAILTRDAPATARLQRILASHLERARKEPAVYACVHQALAMPGLLPLGYDYKAQGRQLFEDLVGLIEEGQRRGEFRAINPRATTATLIGVVGIYLSAVVAGDLPGLPEGLEATIFDLIMHGLEVRSG
ncbi:MAG: TetR/AcrR family transcriptional regulator [Candidatus Eisenbacteria bacterium]